MPIQQGGYRRKVIDTTAAATYTQRIRVQSPVRRVFISQVGVSDDTNNDVVATVGVEAGGTFYPIEAVVLGNSPRYSRLRLNSWLYEGEALRVDWSGVVSGDGLTVTAIGHAEYEA